MCERKIEDLLDIAESLKGLVWKSPLSLNCLVILQYLIVWPLVRAILCYQLSNLGVLTTCGGACEGQGSQL